MTKYPLITESNISIAHSMVLEAKEILRLLREKYRTFARISNITGIDRATLYRIYHNSDHGVKPKTLGKLMQALNAK